MHKGTSSENDPNVIPSAFQDLLQELTNMDQDLLKIQTFKRPITATSSGFSISQQVGSIQHHKRALESSVGDGPTSAGVEAEVSCVQGALRDALAKLSASGQVPPDVTELKQTWQTIQVKN